MTKKEFTLPPQTQLNAERVHKRTSARMALQVWQGYTRKHLERPNGPDLLFRLRLAHTLLLQFSKVYYSQNGHIPTEHSREWLVLKVLNDRHPHRWHIVGQSSG